MTLKLVCGLARPVLLSTAQTSYWPGAKPVLLMVVLNVPSLKIAICNAGNSLPSGRFKNEVAPTTQ